ncbi:unnamed protein product [Dovyalis caffra]|uniref:Uncharacterized protein n=1 Tax=Dovyalis caffra TaxID=77055 RepID=A0AAV1RT36_9ROSI|nr:unnamed protein product [Dovyalis caffra]
MFKKDKQNKTNEPEKGRETEKKIEDQKTMAQPVSRSRGANRESFLGNWCVDDSDNLRFLSFPISSGNISWRTTPGNQES